MRKNDKSKNTTTANNMTGGESMTDADQSGNVSKIAIGEKGKPAEKPGK